jgi:hypothetical protein
MKTNQVLYIIAYEQDGAKVIDIDRIDDSGYRSRNHYTNNRDVKRLLHILNSDAYAKRVDPAETRLFVEFWRKD